MESDSPGVINGFVAMAGSVGGVLHNAAHFAPSLRPAAYRVHAFEIRLGGRFAPVSLLVFFSRSRPGWEAALFYR